MRTAREEYVVNLDACIKCSACTAQCPVAAVYPLFPGPKNVGPDAERFRLEGIVFDPAYLTYCSNCKTCEVTCPSGVNITEMILRARGKEPDIFTLSRLGAGVQSWPESKQKSRRKLRNYLLGRAEYLGKVGTVWPRLSNLVLEWPVTRRVLEASIGLSRKAPLPPYQPKFVPHQGRKVKLGPGMTKQVVYFPGCFVNYNDSAVGHAVVAVLEHNGFDVIVPNFHCCGVPLEANGYFAAAEANSRQNLSLMQAYLEAGVPVISACTSCSLALREEYPKVDAPGAERMGRQTYDLFEFLWELHETGELDEQFQEVSASLGYYAPCHLKAQGIGTPSVRLLKLIPGVEIFDINAGCCGLSGSFAFKEERYSLAMEIGRPLFEQVKAGVLSGEFKEMATECGGCKIQIEHGSGVATKHPVWVLLQAYRLGTA